MPRPEHPERLTPLRLSARKESTSDTARAQAPKAIFSSWERLLTNNFAEYAFILAHIPLFCLSLNQGAKKCLLSQKLFSERKTDRVEQESKGRPCCLELQTRQELSRIFFCDSKTQTNLPVMKSKKTGICLEGHIPVFIAVQMQAAFLICFRTSSRSNACTRRR